MTDKITAYKGFDKNLKCLDFQYEIGKTYKHDGDVKACNSGFHACQNPFDVFGYYPPSQARFAIVTMEGQTSSDEDNDSKLACTKITVDAEISMPEFIKRGVDYIISRVSDDNKEHNTGDRSAASNTGYQSAASVEGVGSIALVTGLISKAKASKGCGFILIERKDDGSIKKIHTAIAGKKGIKPDVYYTLEDGKIVVSEK